MGGIRTSGRTAQLRARATEVAAGQSGVLCRRQLREHGLPRWLVQLEVRAGRWRRTGQQTVVTHNGPLLPGALRAVAAYEASPRAALDGITALQHHGATGLNDLRLHVIVPRGARGRRRRGVVLHESRRFDEADVTVVRGVRTVRPAVAAVHAALWATSDRQASLFLLSVVQQRIATAQDLAEAAAAVRRHPRRRLLRRVALEAAGGVHSMNELDVAVALRARGLPEPDRQVVRRRPSGSEYLDVRWTSYGVTLEIDGAGHEELAQRVADVLRDFVLVAEGDAVLRLPITVFRVAREQVLDRVERVLLARGWHGRAA